ncbi:MAG TPA: CNP1-like family protein [Sulfuricaulis sp.]
MALTAATFPLLAKSGQFSTEPEYFEFDESLVEKWKESEVTLPPYPKDQHLLPVTLPATETLKIFIDRASLSRGTDRVARFTLVVESPSGARSIFYDGIRCETREYKTYALGSSEQTFTPVKNAQWQQITHPALNAFRYHLYRNLICDAHSSARVPEELMRLLMTQ